LGELCQKRQLPFRDYLLVLKPEVEDIAHQKNRRSLIRDEVKPSDDSCLPLPARLKIWGT
jgi:hypothetical protein